MILHGDDTYNYPNIRMNFSSNVYNHFDHSGLFRHLSERMEVVMSYPEPMPFTLERKLAEMMGIGAENVMVTNGATEAIYLIAQAFRGSVSQIVQPTFSEYVEACRMAGHTVRNVGDLEMKDSCDMLWLCNPNNPTGRMTAKEVVVNAVTSHQETVFVLDHSYASFTNLPILSNTESIGFENVLTLHSMTKDFAIPGLRLGYVVASERLIRKLKESRMPWSVNALAIEAGLYLLDHKEEYKMDVEMLFAERKRVASALSATGCIEVFPSDTHILLCKLKSGSAAMLKEALAEKGILIRNASNFEGLDDSYFRIAVQTKEENEELLIALEQLGVKSEE